MLIQTATLHTYRRAVACCASTLTRRSCVYCDQQHATATYPMRSTTLLTLTFTGGPWDGRTFESEETQAWLRVDGEGTYRLTGWAVSHGQEQVNYTWHPLAGE